MMCIICFPLPKNWNPSWIAISEGIGCGNHASVLLSRRPWRGRATTTNFGVSADLVYSVDGPLRYFVPFGNGAKKKQKRQIALLFTSCGMRSS
jgi:hypothetical protein